MRAQIILVFIFIFISGFTGGFAQSNNQSGSAEDKRSYASSVDPSPIFPENSASRKRLKKSTIKSSKAKFKGSFAWQLEQKKKDYGRLMKENARKYRKEWRQSLKPQFSDPMYFGHKKKPKKRPPGKRRLCKECGIVH